MTVTPDCFAAAVDYVGISDLANFMRTLPPFVKPYMVANWYRYVGDPAVPEQEADMLARSPITMVDRIRTPLLVAQGANDARVVQAESDNIVAALRERGVRWSTSSPRTRATALRTPRTGSGIFRAIEGTSPSTWGVAAGSAEPDRIARPGPPWRSPRRARRGRR